MCLSVCPGMIGARLERDTLGHLAGHSPSLCLSFSICEKDPAWTRYPLTPPDLTVKPLQAVRGRMVSFWERILPAALPAPPDFSPSQPLSTIDPTLGFAHAERAE